MTNIQGMTKSPLSNTSRSGCVELCHDELSYEFNLFALSLALRGEEMSAAMLTIVRPTNQMKRVVS